MPTITGCSPIPSGSDWPSGLPTASQAGAVAHVPLLAQLVILTDIPQATTEPNQTEFTRNAAQPELARPNWNGLSGLWAVIS
jgi:hypothetical protein